MNDEHKIKRIRFDGREYEIIHAYLYAGEKPFNIWLRDTETGQFAHQCCEGIDEFALGDHQLVIRDKYFHVLAEAGGVKRVGEAFAMPGRGSLHKCEVAVREPVQDVYEWVSAAGIEAPAVPDAVREAKGEISSGFGGSAEDGKNPYGLAHVDSPRVFFEGRERRVIFAAIDIGHFVDIWLTDAETDKITHCCTAIDPGSRIDEYEVLIHDKYMGILMENGVLKPRGEVVMKDFEMLHRCKMLERGFIPWLDYHADFAKEIDEKSTQPVNSLEKSTGPIHADRELDDRDLGDEIEL